MANSGDGDFSTTNYSWSYRLSGNSPGQSQYEPLWIWEPSEVYPVSDAEYLLKNKRTRAETIIRKDVLSALQWCRQFRTLDAHTQAICGAMPGLANQRNNVRQVLGTLAQRGILRSADDLVESLKYSALPATLAPLEKVIIRTCERPELLKRLLDSLIANETQFNNRYHYILIDDSMTAFAREQNAALVAGLSETDALCVEYYGSAQQQRFLEQLLEVFPDYQESLQWLLMGSGKNPGQTYGRSWNHALLLSAGQRFLLLDDDAVCQAYQPQRASQPGIEISTRQEQVYFYESREALLTSIQPAEFDPLERHAVVLGMPLTGVAQSGFTKPIDVESLQHLTTEQLLAFQATSPAMLTGNSLFGDPGTGSMHWLFELEGESLAQFVKSEADYRRYCQERHLWKGFSELHASPDKALMTTTLTGIDNRHLLPPTVPERRGEDQLFGEVLKYLYPASLSVYFPWGLLHLPEPQRQWDSAALQRPLRPNVLSLMADLARPAAIRCLSSTPQLRLASLAALYTDLAGADATVLRNTIEEHWLADRTDFIRSLNKALQTFSKAPEYWREDVQRIIRANLSDNEMATRSLAAVETASAFLAQYASALTAWPDVWNYCQDHDFNLQEGAFL